MPPVRTSGGRASKACEGCRKGKTRCYTSSAGACLRCNTLRLKCSLQDEPADPIVSDRPMVVAQRPRHDCSAVEDRLSSLERTVHRLTETIGLDLDQDPMSSVGSSAQHDLPTLNFGEEAPLLVIQEAVSEANVLRHGVTTPETIIDKGILSTDEVLHLLTIFQANYRRWIALRENDPIGQALDMGNSPLLLCACCLIAVRHWNSPRAVQTVDILFSEAKWLLSQQLLGAPQPLAFFQAVLLLSLWSTTVGQTPLSIDSWLITGYAIQQALASDVFKDATCNNPPTPVSNSAIGTLLLWDRICLAHLHACVSMRRTAMVQKSEIERIRKRLPPTELSNYEIRMVAEVSLYLSIYENAIATSVILPQAQAALQSWKNVWGFLFDQPRPQFIQMGFHFAQLLIFEQSLNNKSAAVRESLLSEMVRLCSAILQIGMDTSDDRTKHLTDHVYHLITFAAVTLCRLLCKYETQLQTRINIDECDVLVLNVARWLRSLGSPLHVGHTMSTVIGAVHRKLRPGVHMTLRRENEPEQATPDQNTFPGLLSIPMGMEFADFDWDAMVPDWKSFASGEDLV